MNGQNKENLKDLFGRFLDSKQAEQAARDIEETEHLLRQYPAPEPDRSLIAGIKAEVQKVVLRKKRAAFRTTVYKTATVAAVIVISITIGIKLLEKNNIAEKTFPPSIVSDTIEQDDDIFADNGNLEILVAEAEQIGDEILALQLNENGDNEYRDITELEMELIETNSTFWKG